MKRCMMFVMLFCVSCISSAALVTDGLIIHLDASSITGLNDEDAVTSWADLATADSVNGNVSTKNGWNAPIYKPSVLNGKAVVRMQGGDLLASASFAFPNVDDGLTIFIVATGDSSGEAGERVLQIGKNTDPTAGKMLGVDFSTNTDLADGGSGARFNNGKSLVKAGNPLTTGFHIAFLQIGRGGTYGSLEYYVDDLDAEVFNNTVNKAYTLLLDVSGNELTLGTGIGGTGSYLTSDDYQGDIAEILVYNSQLSQAQMMEVGQYLGDKYGMSFVPEPLLEWKFDGNANDSSGNSKHGTITEGATGSVSFVNAGRNGSIQFTDTKDRVVSPSVNIGSAFTVAGWIKVADDFSGSWNRFLCTDNHATGFFIGQDSTSMQWKFAVNNGWALSKAGNIVPGQWQHVAGTYDGTNGRLYVDGVLVSGPAAMPVPSTPNQPIVLGRDAIATNNGFPGMFDEIKVYDRALTATEIAGLLLSGNSPVDNACGVDSDVSLSWPAIDATQYAVYFGDDFASVRAANVNDTTGIYKGLQSSPAYSPGTLVDGTTYYWRIDQHDNSDPNIYWTGPVWTFTVGYAKYRFDGSMSRETTEAYLAKSMTWGLGHTPSQFAEDLRCILNIGAKFIGRTATPWDMVSHPSVSNVADDEYYFDRLAYYADLIHAKDHEIILQGCIFEAVCSAYDTGLSTGTRVRPGVEDIPIPAWVFEEFDQQVVQRNFSYQDMIYTDGYKNDYWQPGVSVQDITRLETKMWTYYRARRFIDAGYESIHFGQTDQNYISHNDSTRASLYNVLGRIRSYASQKARRGFVLCDAHDGLGVVQSGQLLYDIHLNPSRPQEQCGTPYEAILKFGYSLYGRSAGGTTPSGWYCDSLPYNVEIDNFGINYWQYVGTCGNLPGTFWVWGWDEMSWYAHCSESYRNDWLRYAVEWLMMSDPVGYLRMPGCRGLEDGAYDPEQVWTNVYRPNNSPYGFNQEETIKSLFNPTWAYLLADGFEKNFDKWTDGGTTDWDRTTSQKHSGNYSAHAGSADNDLISDNLDTSGYSSITIEFWYRDDDIDDDDDVYLQLYNGSYVNRFELGNTSPEDTWHFYTTTIYNSGDDAQYFRSDFRIKFEGTSIDSGENLWIDDVLIIVE